MGFINSFKDEIKFLFSGKGMPYEKVCLTVAMIISVFLNLDNSKYSRELITQIDSSEYMRVKAVLNVPTTPNDLFYRDEADAVIYLPEGLEKNFYSGSSSPVGIFYDNSNTAQTADITTPNATT